MGLYQNLSTKYDLKTSIFLIILHLIVFIGVPYYFMTRTISVQLIVITIILYILTGISITAGYHRYYSHRAYKASKPVELFFLFFGTLSMGSNVVYWAHKHRLHHRFADKEGDPHNINESFFHAHMGWLFKKQIPVDNSIIPDIIENKLTYYQHKYYHFLMFGSNILVTLLIGWYLNDYLGAFIIAWFLRVLLVQHSTWFINSLAHTWGDKTYSKEQTAVNNAIISLLTFGEGYHNYHHAFQSDYRNGVRWYQFDPTKWLIWTLSKLGLTSELRRMDPYIAKNKIIEEDKKIFLHALEETSDDKKHVFREKVQNLSEKIQAKIADLKKMIKEYNLAKENKSQDRSLKNSIKEAEKQLKSDWKSWLSLEKEIGKFAPLKHYHG